MRIKLRYGAGSGNSGALAARFILAFELVSCVYIGFHGRRFKQKRHDPWQAPSISATCEFQRHVESRKLTRGQADLRAPQAQAHGAVPLQEQFGVRVAFQDRQGHIQNVHSSRVCRRAPAH